MRNVILGNDINSPITLFLDPVLTRSPGGPGGPCKETTIFLTNKTSTYAWNNNNNSNLYSCPEITQFRLKYKREKKYFKGKEHSQLEIAMLIELSGWPSGKKFASTLGNTPKDAKRR